jgi:2-oxoglutarate dehydrogenase E2 component (dihydrolipoamide succinyltransferase)
VRRIADAEGVDLSQVTGTGRGGRIRKQDVMAFLEERNKNGSGATPAPPPLHIESPYQEEPAASPPAPAPAAAESRGATSEPLSRMRQSIAEHMVRSLHTAAHCTSIMEVDMSAVEAARAQLGVTALALVARATIDALRAHPSLNATLQDGVLTRHQDVNLGIAVSLGEDGLIVPVIARAQEYSAEGLAARIRELASHARDRTLTPDDVSGGTFTITNPGSFGTLASTPIINQPQVAILDLEAVVKRAVVVTDDRGDSIAIHPMTNLCLSWDHRALDGALAAQFLSTVRERLEDWRG